MQPNPIRVALDAHSVGQRQTGNETYAVNLAKALAARSDVTPLVFLPKGVAWSGPDAAAVHHLRTGSPFLRIPFELPIRAHRAGADLLHVQYVAPPITPIPVVTTIHDLSFEDAEGLFGRRTELRLRALVPVSARRSAAVITVSAFTRGRLLERYGLDPARVFVTPNGVAASWRPLSEGERSERLREFLLPPTFVLAVGNLHPRKNIVRLIRAIHALRTGHLGDLHLVLAGQRGWRAEEVDRQIEAVDGQSWVHTPGYVSDETLRALYGAARVVAYPSLYEGFGFPALEALACGAVLVASSTTSIPEVVGDAAILVDPADEAAISDALARAVTDETLRSRLMAAGPVQAAYFTWARCAEATVVAYRAAITRQEPGVP